MADPDSPTPPNRKGPVEVPFFGPPRLAFSMLVVCERRHKRNKGCAAGRRVPLMCPVFLTVGRCCITQCTANNKGINWRNIKQIKDGKEDTPLLERPIPAAAATAACQKKNWMAIPWQRRVLLVSKRPDFLELPKIQRWYNDQNF